MMRTFLACLTVAFGLTLTTGAAQAFDAAAMRVKVEEMVRAHASELQGSPVVIAALRDANTAQATLSDAEIDALDKDWRAQTKTGRGPLIDPIQTHAASDVLRGHQAKSLGMMAEIFVYGQKGLNVAQTNVTSDYLQADEPKYQKTFPNGPGAVHVEEAKFDESVNTYVMTGSASLTDPDTGAVIGVVTVNVDLGRI